MTVEELKAGAERDEHLARIAARQCELIDPSRSYSRTYGVDIVASDYDNDELGCAQFRADLASARLKWLEGRWEVLSESRERLHRARRAREVGVDRFVGEGRFRLNDLLRPEFERQRAEAAKNIVTGRDLMMAGKEMPPAKSWMPHSSNH